MSKDSSIFIDHILESIAAVEEYTAGLSKEDFLNGRQIQDAVIRRLEVIGEAARHLPQETRNLYSEVEWKQIVALRNLLIHEYFGVNLDLVWKVVQSDVPKLKSLLVRMQEKVA
ncbi:MAG: hypothetical protein UY30_C0010G0008 [Parcubacteria group bacterium GW2011_GWB1_48_6]|nr:MAG: hypothetical protein UY30_C0010G0008 [Parcubacteria group bacterium GW2011_GWB1_48_6]HXK35774.1 DUF86 domain-containing protein [Candidatus Paceibacterota bacterium]